jgi:hypothetical protein
VLVLFAIRVALAGSAVGRLRRLRSTRSEPDRTLAFFQKARVQNRRSPRSLATPPPPTHRLLRKSLVLVLSPHFYAGGLRYAARRDAPHHFERHWKTASATRSERSFAPQPQKVCMYWELGEEGLGVRRRRWRATEKTGVFEPELSGRKRAFSRASTESSFADAAPPAPTISRNDAGTERSEVERQQERPGNCSACPSIDCRTPVH